MEPIEANISEGEWSYDLSGMYANEEADFMAQLLNNFPPPNDFNLSSSFKVPYATYNWLANESSYYSSDHLYRLSQESISSANGNYYPHGSDRPVLVSSNSSVSLDCLNQEIMSESNVDEESCDKNMKFKSEHEREKNHLQIESLKKRSRSSGDVQNTKKNVRSKKNQKLGLTNNNEEDGNVGRNGQSTSSCWSEDDSNGSQELNGGLASSSSTKRGCGILNGKTRANRGSATDPQSLYARKRRERINERLRILQNLVPNGTKVDISTMLEEAVEYVKFLQLQIKLLSSDDLWMYAPIAYNGLDIGLDLKLGAPRNI